MSQALMLADLRNLVIGLGSISDPGGDVVRYANLDAPRAAAPFVTLQVITDTALGRPWRASSTTISEARQARVQVDFYGATMAGPTAQRVATSLRADAPARRAWLALGRGYGIHGVGDLVDAPAVPFQSGVEPRTRLELLVGYTVTLSDVGASTTATAVEGSLTGEPLDLDPIEAADVVAVDLT